jgi:hypothetical protein
MNGMRREVGWALGACLGLLGCPGKLAPTTCQEEPSIDCGQCGARGFVCQVGAQAPDPDGGPYACTMKSTTDDQATYCCFSPTLLPTSCSYDESFVCDDPFPIPYDCGMGEDPTAFVTSLTCSGPMPVDSAHVHFCCRGPMSCDGG